MKQEYVFTPQWRILGKMPEYSESQIKKETMLFSASESFAWKNGGEITKRFIKSLRALDQLEGSKSKWIIDSRVHMLMPGWYPCIPGWHHDDVPRSGDHDQPDYDTPEYQSEHIMTVIGPTAMPEFLNVPVTVSKVPSDQIVYKEWNDEINLNYTGKHERYSAQSGEIISFTWEDFHRGMPADKNGWRYFVRASRNTNRVIKNEIRSQVQVYMSDLEAGW